jgi:hypothetical protein
MVLYMTSADAIADIPRIARMMINIETNRSVYDKHGNRNSDTATKKSFNRYAYKQVVYDATVNIGHLYVYAMRDLSEFIELLSEELDTLTGLVNYANMTPTSAGVGTSTQYTLITRADDIAEATNMSTHTTTECHYRCVVTRHNRIQAAVNSGTHFVWHIVDNATRYSPLFIMEMGSTVITSEYLYEALSTIIYDEADTFAMVNNTKQLDYPRVDQYSKAIRSCLIPETIPIKVKDIELEVMTSYIDISGNAHTHIPVDAVNQSNSDAFVTPPNLQMPWMKHLSQIGSTKTGDTYKVSLHITKEKVSRKLCFVSRAPLYGKIAIITMTNGPSTVSIAVNNFIINMYITSSNSVMKTSLVNLITENTNYAVSNIQFKRCSGGGLLRALRKSQISPTRKSVMFAILKNGVSGNLQYSYRAKNTKQAYTFNIQDNAIYYGVTSANSSDIHPFIGTITKVFQLRR